LIGSSFSHPLCDEGFLPFAAFFFACRKENLDENPFLSVVRNQKTPRRQARDSLDLFAFPRLSFPTLLCPGPEY
jgi:hypothetical protein